MPVPYRKTPKASREGYAAYLDVLWIRSTRVLYGALMLMDGHGQPVEFVHNALSAPDGFLWPDALVLARGTADLAHSLFDACRRDPELLVCLSSLGSPEFCRAEIAPSIPFAQVTPARAGTPAEWSWINEPPVPGMRAYVLYQDLTRRGFVEEPFERIRDGLRIVYPEVSWHEADEESPGVSTKGNTARAGRGEPAEETRAGRERGGP